MATVAAWAERTHYQRHLIPIWQAIPEPNRAGVDLADYVMVAGPKDAATFSRRKLIYVEHGAGQSYRNPDGDGWVPLYSGGDGFGNVALFICPNSEVAARWEARYPAARTAVVGCPALDRFHQAPKLEDPRTVAFTFHWDAMGVAPEARSAFEHYRADLPLIIKLIQREGWKVIGHEHPRWDGQLAMHFEQLGVEFWEYRTVMDHASVLVGDNTSMLYEFASLGRPTVVLNAPWYRKTVEHGGRFWEHITGPMVDRPRDVADVVCGPLDPAAGMSAATATYTWLDGQAASRAAAAIMSM